MGVDRLPAGFRQYQPNDEDTPTACVSVRDADGSEYVRHFRTTMPTWDKSWFEHLERKRQEIIDAGGEIL